MEFPPEADKLRSSAALRRTCRLPASKATGSPADRDLFLRTDLWNVTRSANASHRSHASAPRGTGARDALPQVGRRQDLAAPRAAQARPQPAAPVPRAIRRRRGALLRGGAPAGGAERRERRADPLLAAGARRRPRGARRPRRARLRPGPLRGGAGPRPVAPRSGGARGAVHLPQQDVLQRPVAGETPRPPPPARRAGEKTPPPPPPPAA